MTRVALLALLLCVLGGGTVSADTLTIDAYRSRLREARSLVLAARSAPAAQRSSLASQAAGLLRTTDRLTLRDGSTLAVDDGALASRVAGGGDAALTAALADLDARLAAADGAVATRLSGAVVDERLRAVLPAAPAAQAEDGLLSFLIRFLELLGRALGVVTRATLSFVDPAFVVAVVTGVGIAIALIVLGVLGRGVRERIRHEALSGDLRTGATEDPAEHLRRADAAIASGRARDALHELYLFALAALAARGTIRFDPALTDRELLARAAAIPQIASLRTLVALHERAWFGLKPAEPADAARARALAEEVAA